MSSFQIIYSGVSMGIEDTRKDSNLASTSASFRSLQREEYWARINRALDYIEQNIEQELRLEEIARVANFSAFHFHRIFRAMVGETLNRFIQRIRIEKAASMLLANKKKSITEIALDSGFSSSAVFARVFKEMYTMSASQWRNGGYVTYRKECKTESKICKTVSKRCKESRSGTGYIDSVGKDGAVSDSIYSQADERNFMSKFKPDVRIEEMKEMQVAYVRHIGPYKANEKLFEQLFDTLMRWAGPRGFVNKDAKVLIVYHDNPDVTDESNLRTSCCITVPAGTRAEGEIGMMTIPAGKYACGHFELRNDEYQNAWDAVCGDWLPESGYQPDDRPSFELCLNDPHEHPEGKHVVDICIPVKPL